MLLRKLYGRENTFTAPGRIYILKYPHISGLTQFKPILFKGQLH